MENIIMTAETKSTPEIRLAIYRQIIVVMKRYINIQGHFHAGFCYAIHKAILDLTSGQDWDTIAIPLCFELDSSQCDYIELRAYKPKEKLTGTYARYWFPTDYESKGAEWTNRRISILEEIIKKMEKDLAV